MVADRRAPRLQGMWRGRFCEHRAELACMTEPATPCHSPSIGKRETQLLKLTADRPFADPDKAARRLLEHAHVFEPIQDGRIYIEKLNGPFLYIDRGSPAEYSAGLKLAIERGWLEMHDSGTYVKFTAAGVELSPDRFKNFWRD
jgi:hypothetical protein